MCTNYRAIRSTNPPLLALTPALLLILTYFRSFEPQLVGVTAMLLASKYEEIWAPEVRDFVYISDKAYTREQILDMEKQMLNTLGFHLTVPTPYQFMSRFFKAANADKQFQLLASFIVESALPDYSMLKYPASLLAASAVYVAMKTLNKGSWNEVMQVGRRRSWTNSFSFAS